MTLRGRNEISLGDLAIAIKRLPTQDREHLAKIAGCLGFGLMAVEPPKPQRKGHRGKAQSTEQEEISDAVAPKPSIQRESRKIRNRVTLPKPPPPVDGYVSHIESLPRDDTSLPSRVDQADPLRLDADITLQAKREPVFVKRTERAILSAAVAVQTDTGHVDLDKVISRLISQKLVERLPRQGVPTLKYGVQLMLDRSESMLPYAQDLQDLEKRLRNITGGSRFWNLGFKGTPLSPLKNRKTGQTQKIINNVPILLITDFGIAAPLLSRDRVSPGDWQKFARQADVKNCPVVALIPHKSRLWPDLAVANFLCIHWDRRTTAGDLRKVIGLGHRLEGQR